MKATKIDLAKLRNEEHEQFHGKVIDLVNQTQTLFSRLDIDTQFPIYVSDYDKEKECYNFVTLFSATKWMNEMDVEREHAYRGFVNAVKSFRKHFNAEKAKAAEDYLEFIESIGNVAKKSEEQETGAIKSIIEKSKTVYAPLVTTLGVGDWLTELETKNNEYEKLFDGRVTEKDSKTDNRMKNVRVDVDASYKAIIERLEAFLVIGPNPTIEAFIHKLNSIIDFYQKSIALRKGVATKEETSVEAKN